MSYSSSQHNTERRKGECKEEMEKVNKQRSIGGDKGQEVDRWSE